LSIASSNCRIDWRPSRLLCIALAGLGVLAAISVALSDLSPWGKAPLGFVALAYGFWLARREWRRPPCELEIDAEGKALMDVGGNTSAVLAAHLSLRGVVATLSWRDEQGRRDSRVWCADTLPVTARRDLRLRLGSGQAA
jgi:toxin CptA